MRRFLLLSPTSRGLLRLPPPPPPPLSASMAFHSSPRLFEEKENGGRKSLYDVLGAPPTATAAELKLAYFKRARRVHPDLNESPEAVEEFRRLEIAYRTLADDFQRRLYDENQEEGGPASEDPRWKQYANPEAMRQRWRDVTRDREIIAEAVKGEKEEVEQDLAELKDGLMSGDLSSVGTFVRHQPFLAALILTPFAAVSLATRYPPLAVAMLRMLPHVRFWSILLVPQIGVLQGACTMVGFDLSDMIWRRLVKRAKARQQRRSAKRILP